MTGELLMNMTTSGLTLISIVVSLPVWLFGLECILGHRRGTSTAPTHRGVGLRVTVLIPAHNESANIERTLRSVSAQLMPQDAILVVADNCSDNTAELARTCGAQVHERQHDSLRGKGYALDHGIKVLDSQGLAPDIVIMVDADCQVHPGCIDALVHQCTQSQGPVQARYLMQAGPDAPLSIKVAALAWLIKNQIRPAGTTRLGWPCHLTGSGMAFPWSVIRSAPLASGNLVEDMCLGIDLTLAGHPSRYCEQALVTSEFPVSLEGQASQRTRWEHGHIATILEQAPKLLRHGLRNANLPMIGMALDLCIPPLSSLVLMCGAWTLIVLAFGFLTQHWAPVGPVLAGMITMMVGFFLAWHRHGRQVVSAHELWSIPRYVGRKLPIYLGFFTKRQVAWVRTRRDDGQK